ELVREIFLLGPIDEQRARLAEFGEAGITTAVLALVAPPDAVEATIDAFAPSATSSRWRTPHLHSPAPSSSSSTGSRRSSTRTGSARDRCARTGSARAAGRTSRSC